MAKVNVSAMIEGSCLSTSVRRSLAIAVSVMLSMFILAGTFGNALVCDRLRSRHDLRKVPHYLLTSLSLTGLLTSLLTKPSFLIATIVNYRQAGLLPVPEMLCKVGFPLSIGYIALKELSLTLMTIKIATIALFAH